MMEINANTQMDVDVLIAGGGVAGSAAAAALSPLGLKILVIEPKSSHGRRLAGELIHPPGIDGLKQLGLLADEPEIGSPIRGFSIFPFKEGAEYEESIILPYSEVEGLDHGGMAIEHQSLKEHLLPPSARRRSSRLSLMRKEKPPVRWFQRIRVNCALTPS